MLLLETSFPTSLWAWGTDKYFETNCGHRYLAVFSRTSGLCLTGCPWESGLFFTVLILLYDIVQFLWHWTTFIARAWSKACWSLCCLQWILVCTPQFRLEYSLIVLEPLKIILSPLTIGTAIVWVHSRPLETTLYASENHRLRTTELNTIQIMPWALIDTFICFCLSQLWSKPAFSVLP